MQDMSKPTIIEEDGQVFITALDRRFPFGSVASGGRDYAERALRNWEPEDYARLHYIGKPSYCPSS